MHKYSLAVKFTPLCQLLFFSSHFLQCIVFTVTKYAYKVSFQIQQVQGRYSSKKKAANLCFKLKNITRNIKFVYDCLVTGAVTTFLTWLGILLLMSGDVHPNPGQNSTSSHSSSSSTSNDSFSFINTLNLSKHLSFVQYNVQSIVNKLDVLSTELSDFVILAFSETWRHTNIQTVDLLIPDFKPPERKDRTADRHGGVMIYVKDTLFYKRRHDLEPPTCNAYGLRFNLIIHEFLLVFSIARQTLTRRTSLALKILYRLHWKHK